MDIGGIISATLVVGIVGLVIGLLLGLAGTFFAVKIDEKEQQIRKCLPGNNCGGCGYAGCDALAHAIFTGEAEANACPVGGAACAEQIGMVLGVEVKAAEQRKAFVRCKGSLENATLNEKGHKVCKYGCIGCGICEKKCKFDAIRVENQLAVVDEEKCVGCGQCAEACPRHVISLLPKLAGHMVACSNLDKGKEAKAVCRNACISCGLCAKVCLAGAISLESGVARIDETKCTGCGACAEKCPMKAIV
ncbi:MAG: RnfABCDGE type electron transport complex subunit B [Lachnospiraceae bacterium]|nr:RnfABCDGE type electron transport complex subunit B [Lachnospiraceae bacterium]